jgi:heme oxygenase
MRPALAVELHAATREKHHELNVQIMARLPLCLPPVASDPAFYTQGMTVFGQIYFAFEDSLVKTLARTDLDQRLRIMSEQIYFPRLLRTARLRSDIAILKSGLDRTLADELSVLETDAAAFYQRIEDSLSERPHTVLAYAWSMYLALFNGGRVIRKQLAEPEAMFWRGDGFPLSFWDFDDDGVRGGKGEDLKVAFKEAFLLAADVLTDKEREDVIAESQALFDLCLEMVYYLDHRASPPTSAMAPTCVQDGSDRPVYDIFGLTSIAMHGWLSVARRF